MSKNDEARLDTKVMQKLMKALSNVPDVEVGVLGNGNARSGGKATNALIGAVHEFGSPVRNIPQRSWLRMPLAEELVNVMKSKGAFTEQALGEIVKNESFNKYAFNMGVCAVDSILMAFESGGFGKWQASVGGKKQNHATLIETTQLMRSVSFRVTDG